MIHIQKFLDKVKSIQARRKMGVGGAHAQLILSIDEANNLRDDITELLLINERLRASMNESSDSEVIQIEIDGKEF